jgi:hypothetical protein
MIVRAIERRDWSEKRLCRKSLCRYRRGENKRTGIAVSEKKKERGKGKKSAPRQMQWDHGEEAIDCCRFEE